MIELVLSDPELRKKFSKLITTIMEEDSTFKARLTDLFAKEARRNSYNV
jgi:hypothetical protein